LAQTLRGTPITSTAYSLLAVVKARLSFLVADRKAERDFSSRNEEGDAYGIARCARSK